MKTFINRAAQGDLFIRRIEKLPSDVIAVDPVNGQHVCAHSETGHSHIIKESPGVKLYSCDDPLVSYLEVVAATDETEVLLEHLRSFDTHETIKIPDGIFEIRRQREYVPEGWRVVQD